MRVLQSSDTFRYVSMKTELIATFIPMDMKFTNSCTRYMLSRRKSVQTYILTIVGESMQLCKNNEAILHSDICVL